MRLSISEASGTTTSNPNSTERVADQVLPRVEGDAAARDVDDARRVRPLLVIVVPPFALLERLPLVFHVLLGARLGRVVSEAKIIYPALIFSPIRCAPLVGPR